MYVDQATALDSYKLPMYSGVNMIYIRSRYHMIMQLHYIAMFPRIYYIIHVYSNKFSGKYTVVIRYIHNIVV